jgi:hypothetical protein
VARFRGRYSLCCHQELPQAGKSMPEVASMRCRSLRYLAVATRPHASSWVLTDHPGRFDGLTWLRGSVDILLAVAAVAAGAVFRTSV